MRRDHRLHLLKSALGCCEPLAGFCGDGVCWDGHWCSGEERVLPFRLEESVVIGRRRSCVFSARLARRLPGLQSLS